MGEDVRTWEKKENPGAAENELKNDVHLEKGLPLKNDVQSEALQPAGQQSIMSEFFIFLKEEKKWWLGPLVVVLLALSAVIIFAEGSAIAPFIYSIF